MFKLDNNPISSRKKGSYKKIPIEIIDLIYLITCLFIDLVYTINKTIIKETSKIFGRKQRTQSIISSENEEDETEDEDDIINNVYNNYY